MIFMMFKKKNIKTVSFNVLIYIVKKQIQNYLNLR